MIIRRSQQEHLEARGAAGRKGKPRRWDRFAARGKALLAGIVRPESGCAPSLRRLVKSELTARAHRNRLFKGSLFADPAWDILLELFAIEEEEEGRLPVAAVGAHSGVPAATTLRWLNALQENGLVERTEDATDGRRAFVNLWARGEVAMRRHFQTIAAVS